MIVVRSDGDIGFRMIGAFNDCDQVDCLVKQLIGAWVGMAELLLKFLAVTRLQAEFPESFRWKFPGYPVAFLAGLSASQSIGREKPEIIQKLFSIDVGGCAIMHR